MSTRSVGEWILGRALPRDAGGEAIRGDLRTERDLRAERYGQAAADRWFLLQATSVWLFATRDGLLGRSWGGGPRSGADVFPSGPEDGILVRSVRQVRLAIRSLARSPGYSVPTFVILSLGMTAATAIFTVADGILFRPLDLPESRRLVIVCEDHARLQGVCIASPGNVEDFRRRTTTLTDVGIGRGWPFSLTDAEGTRGVRGGLASAAFLRALRVRPAVGRIFLDGEVGPDDNRVALLNHGFWATRYGGREDVVGSTIRLDGEPYEVVGVLPARLDIPFDLDGVEVWTPPHFDPLAPEVRGWRGFRAIGRLADDASLPAASAELTTLYADLARDHPEIDDAWRLRVEPLLDVVVGDTRPVLMAFLGAAGLLLLIVCANVANLLLARGIDRRRELAVRAALGADRRQLVTGILMESLVLAVAATAAALVLTSGATRLLVSLAPPEIPRLDEVTLDGRVVVFAAVLSVLATAIFAALPAVRVTRWHLAPTLKSGGQARATGTSGRLRSGLVVAELALSVVLLASAGLLTRSFAGYLDWEPGFDRSSLLAVSAFVDTGKYPTRASYTEFWRTAETAVEGIPGVEAVATASAGPLFGGGDGATSFRISGTEAGDALPSAEWFDVGPGYFSTLGLPMVEGREITEDDGSGAPPVAVVNEAFARAAGIDGPVVGRLVELPELDLELQVVGVVADVPPMAPGTAPRPQIYWSNRQLGRPATFFLVRTRGDAAGSARAVTDALLAQDPDLSLGTPRSLVRAEERALVRPRFQALVLLAFGMMALMLSAVGVYAVVSYAVGRRIREIGIRMALGADASDIVSWVLRSNLIMAVAGIGIGLGASLWVGRGLRGMIHGVSPGDPVSLGGAAVVLLVAAVLSTLVPARSGLRADPLEAIRSD